MDKKFKSYQEWDTSDVSDWLANVLKLPQYAQQFEEIAVDGSMMDHIKDEDLESDCGIKVRLHRVKIIEGIRKLQNESKK